jgi:hypothetical protein
MHKIRVSYCEFDTESGNATIIRAACQLETTPKCHSQGLCTFSYPKTDQMSNLYTDLTEATGPQKLAYVMTELEDGEGAFRGYVRGWPHSPDVSGDEVGTFKNYFNFYKCPEGRNCKMFKLGMTLGYGFSCDESSLVIECDSELILSYDRLNYDILESPYIVISTDDPVYVGLFTQFEESSFIFNPDPSLSAVYFDFTQRAWTSVSIPSANIRDVECEDPKYSGKLSKCWRLTNKNEFFQQLRGYYMKLSVDWKVAPKTSKRYLHHLLNDDAAPITNSALTPFIEDKNIPIALIATLTSVGSIIVLGGSAIVLFSIVMILKKKGLIFAKPMEQRQLIEPVEL